MQGYLPYLVALVAIAGFVFSVYQYVDTKRVSEKNKRFDQFHRVFEWVAGRTAGGIELVDTQQAIAVYELSNFPEYKDMSLPIINYYLEVVTSGASNASLLRRALLETQAKLSA